MLYAQEEDETHLHGSALIGSAKGSPSKRNTPLAADSLPARAVLYVRTCGRVDRPHTTYRFMVPPRVQARAFQRGDAPQAPSQRRTSLHRHATGLV